MNGFFNKKNLMELHTRYKNLVKLLAILVVFGTTYALILPALTLDQNKSELTGGIDLPKESTTENLLETLTTADSESSVEQSVIAPETTEEGTTTSELSTPERISTTEETVTSPETKDLITDPVEMKHENAHYILSAQFDGSAQLPKGVELKVTELDASSSDYQNHLEKTKEVLGTKKLRHARFLDISFLYQGQEVEPAAPVTIKIKYNDAVKLSEDSKMKVVHFESDSQVEVVKAETKEKNQAVSEVQFEANSFSVYGDIAVDYYEVDFVYINEDGKEEHIKELLDKTDGSTVGVLPEAPFKDGYRFVHWKNQATGEIVTEDTPVTGNMTVEAVFESISIYTVTATFYYHNKALDKDVVIDTEIDQVEEKDTPFRIVPPASTEVSAIDDSSLDKDAIYYPEQPLLELKSGELATLDKADGLEDHKIALRLAYVPFTAEYDFVYMLKDLDGKGYSEIERKKAHGVLGSTVSPQVLSYNYASFEKSDRERIEQEKGQELHVYYTRKNYTLSYDTNGGSYLEPDSAPYKDSIMPTSVVPQREGYEFEGWYDNANLSGTKITGKVTLDKDKTLYAKWTPKVVNYTIAFYREVYDNATKSTSYVFDSTRTNVRGEVGSTVRATDLNIGSLPSTTSIGRGYRIDDEKNRDSNIIIEADGTSVLQVYYKLERYTFVFDLANRNAQIRMNGRTYMNSQYSIRDVVLGQDVSSLWPSSVGIEIVDNTNYGTRYNPSYRLFDKWTPNFKTKRYEVTDDMLPSSGTSRTYTAIWVADGRVRNVEYWLQEPDGSYKKSDYYSQSFVDTAGLNAKTLFGYTYRGDISFTHLGVRYEGSSGNTYRFYYNRESYPIEYYYGSNLIKRESSVLTGSLINNGNYDYTPTRPSDIDSDFSWGGWYEDPLLTNKYVFDRMPSHGVILYAKWIAPKYTVSFDVNGGSSANPANQTVEKYKRATSPQNPTRDHYNFVGWYTDPKAGQLYDWSKPIEENVKLYARWRLKPLTYTVKYLEAGTNNPLAVDKIETSPSFTYLQDITEKALGIPGYRPDKSSQTIKLDYANNVITFYYSKKTPSVSYKVRYVLADNEAIEVAPMVTKTVEGSQINAKELAVKVDKTYFAKQPGVTPEMVAKSYYPVDDVQNIVLSSTEANNVITFRYRTYDTAQITVNYLDMDGNPIVGQQPETVTRRLAETYLVNQKGIDGYTYDSSKDNSGATNKRAYRITKGEKITIDLYYKKDLSIVARDKEKVYDSTPLRSSKPDDLLDTYASLLKSGDQLQSISYDGEQTNVGVSNVTPQSAKFVDVAGKDRNYYYNIKYIPGTLTVTPVPVTVYVNGDFKDKIYDGLAETVGYTMKIVDQTGLYEESDIQFTGTKDDESITQTNAGSYPLRLENKFRNTDPNFDVIFQISDGELLIGPRVITLTSTSAEKGYDGTDLQEHHVNITVSDGADYDGFVKGEGFDITYLNKINQPGSKLNRFTYTPQTGTNPNNYEIITEFGKLTVYETLNITKSDENWVPLAGGQFELTKWDGINWATYEGVTVIDITSEEGVRIPVGLKPGRYRLKETAAPEGYVVLESDIYFTVTESNTGQDSSESVFAFEVTDGNGTVLATVERAKEVPRPENSDYSRRLLIANEKGRALPNTGGEGRQVFYVTGGLIMVFALIVNKYLGNRRERKS